MSRIRCCFERTLAEGRTALIPYLTLGWPTLDRSIDLVEAVCRSGADLIELGVPYSDPIADGPTIREAGWSALRRGTTVANCLDAVRELRRREIEIPIVLMGYLNPFITRGIDSFTKTAVESGVDGVVVPDITLDTAEFWVTALKQAGLDRISFVAPTTTLDRLPTVVEAGSGFVYCISLVGITGARDSLPDDVPSLVRRVKATTKLPVAVGFGVSRPEHVAKLARITDGVIIGSALIDRIRNAPPDDQEATAAQFVRELTAATVRRQTVQ